MNTDVIAARLVIGGGAVVKVSPRDRGTRFIVQHMLGAKEAFMNVKDQIVNAITKQNVNILGEVNGRQPYNDHVIFLGFRDDLTDTNSLRWPNTMREIGKGAAISVATVVEIHNGTIPGKAIMSYPTVDGFPQEVYTEDGKAVQVALLKRSGGVMTTMIAKASDNGTYLVKNAEARPNQDLLASVTIEGVEYPLTAEVLAHLMLLGYLVVAPVRAMGLIEAQYKLNEAALANDRQAWDTLREDYRQRRIAAEQAHGIYSYGLNQALLDGVA